MSILVGILVVILLYLFYWRFIRCNHQYKTIWLSDVLDDIVPQSTGDRKLYDICTKCGSMKNVIKYHNEYYSSQRKIK